MFSILFNTIFGKHEKYRPHETLTKKNQTKNISSEQPTPKFLQKPPKRTEHHKKSRTCGVEVLRFCVGQSAKRGFFEFDDLEKIIILGIGTKEFMILALKHEIRFFRTKNMQDPGLFYDEMDLKTWLRLAKFCNRYKVANTPLNSVEYYDKINVLNQ